MTEVALDTEAAGEDAQVQLGWGKKETQFHGSVGKQAAQTKTATEGLSEDDDFMPRLSWRGDGNFFVCSFVNAAQSKIHSCSAFLAMVLT